MAVDLKMKSKCYQIRAGSYVGNTQGHVFLNEAREELPRAYLGSGSLAQVSAA